MHISSFSKSEAKLVYVNISMRVNYLFFYLKRTALLFFCCDVQMSNLIVYI